MLTQAIGLIQDIQFICFAVIFTLMVARDRGNRSLRLFAFAYIAGLCGAFFDYGGSLMPGWLSVTCGTFAAPVSFACLHASFVAFVNRGWSTRWISLALLAASMPLYLFWSVGQHPQNLALIVALCDLTLAIQTALTAGLLFSTSDRETAWPRRVIGGFLSIFSAVEFGRVADFAATGSMQPHIFPGLEIASGTVHVVSCSVLPLAFIWMMNNRLHADMARQIVTDPLTQLLNRRGLEQAAHTELARYHRGRERGAELSVLLADIDQFKNLNDAYGHACGDAVLAETAALFRSFIREGDIVSRLGGEEFVLVLPQIPASEAMQVAERLRLQLEAHRFQTGNEQLQITVSFGVAATAARDQVPWSALLGEADQALYAAKRAGRNRCVLFGKEIAAAPPTHGVLNTAFAG